MFHPLLHLISVLCT